MWFQLGLLALSLGLDNLSVSIGIGLGGVSGKRLWQIGLIFGLAQAILPAIGLLIGGQVAPHIGKDAAYVGFSALVIMGLYTIYLSLRTGSGAALDLSSHLGVALAALSVSLDSLAVGFSLAMLGFPVLTSLVAIGFSAFALTVVGLFFGGKLSGRFESISSVAAGIVLTGTGVWLLWQNLQPVIFS